MYHHPVDNNYKQAIIRVIRNFNSNLTEDEAWKVYINTLADENGIYISEQDDEESKDKWIDRLNHTGNLNTTVEEFSKVFAEEYLKVGYYKDLVNYIYSLKGKCKIGLFSDLIYCCYPALDIIPLLDESDFY